MAEEQVLQVGTVKYGKGVANPVPQKLGMGVGVGTEPKVGNLDKSTWQVPEFKGNFTKWPALGWHSVNEEGQLPPGMNNFGALPPGVKPSISPIDRERIRLGGVYTVGDGTHPESSNFHTRWWEGFTTSQGEFNYNFPYSIRKFINSLQIGETKPRYHIRLPTVRPIWECHVNDVWCVAHADRRANIERRVDHNIVTVLQNRLNICHQNASHQENQKWAKNYSYEYFCGELDETVREAEAAFELKWGKLPYRRPEHQMGKLAYLKQKNRYVEDRFRHRMMANVGATYNYDAFTASNQNPTIVDGPDRHVHHAKTLASEQNLSLARMPEFIWSWTGRLFWLPRKEDYMAMSPKWSMDEALMVEAKKRRKLREAAEEDDE